MKKYRVVFFGTPEFSNPSLDALSNNSSIEVCYVVTMPDRPAGRGKKLKSPPVADHARSLNIPIIQTENINKDNEAKAKLAEANADLFIVLAFSQFLSNEILDMPTIGSFNIHTSLLPKYRGAAPIQYALLNGESKTGVSIQRMVKKMDAGNIIYEHDVTIKEHDNSLTLFEKLKQEAATGLNNFIQMVVSEKDLKGKVQDEKNASYAPTIKKSDGHLNPFSFGASELLNQSRAYYPWPGQYIFISGIRIKILKIEVDSSTTLEPGVFDVTYGSMLLGTKSGTIRLSKVQPEGKKPISDKDLINSFKNKNTELVLNKDDYA